jgi:hypothetical protein
VVVSSRSAQGRKYIWNGTEVDELAAELASESGRSVEVLKRMDRSILVGRHTDTREYNPKLPPIRELANSLHEDYLRTDLERLILDPAMIPAQAIITPFLKRLIRCWNILVEFTQRRLRRNVSLVDMKGWSEFPAPLQFALMTMDRVIANHSRRRSDSGYSSINALVTPRSLQVRIATLRFWLCLGIPEYRGLR